MNKTFWKYYNKYPFLTVIVLTLLLTIVLHIVGIKLFEYWTGNKVIAVKNDFDIFGGVISYVGGVLSVITIIFLYINYHQVKEQNDKNNQDTEFNKISQLVQNQLLFTKEILGDRKETFNSLEHQAELDYMFTSEYYYDHYEKIYNHLELYKRYLSNNLDKEDNKLIFFLIKTNFLDSNIDEIKYVYSLYNGVNTYEIIDKIVYQHYKGLFNIDKHNFDYKYDDEITITKEMIDEKYKKYIDRDIEKLYTLKNILKDILTTYDLYTNS